MPTSQPVDESIRGTEACGRCAFPIDSSTNQHLFG
jgi:hypothetical protein